MRALLAQFASIPGRPADNAATLADVVSANTDIDLVVTPELFLTGYDMSTVRELAIDADGPEIARIRAAAASSGTAAVVGFAERRGDNPANSLALIDARGNLVAVYRKVQLFGNEAVNFEPGERLVVAELARRRIGAMICFDVEFPEVARALAKAGADLLVTASANMAPFFDDHLLATRARALDNHLPHLYTNRVGSEGGYDFVGGTRAISSSGRVQAEIAGSAQDVLVVDVPARGVADNRVDYLKYVRDPVAVDYHRTATGA